MPEVYEWYLSDHPWARGLRQIDNVHSAEPADVVWLRGELERNRTDYRYPQHLIGPGAAACPPPMEANAGAAELRAHLRDSVRSDADDMWDDREADGENWPEGRQDA